MEENKSTNKKGTVALIVVIAIIIAIMLSCGLNKDGNGTKTPGSQSSDGNVVNNNISITGEGDIDTATPENSEGKNGATGENSDENNTGDNDANLTDGAQNLTVTLSVTGTPDGSGNEGNQGSEGDNNTPTPTKAAAVTPVPTSQPAGGSQSSGTPVSLHGKLSVVGTNIVDKNGNVFQLKGVSTHGLQWFPQYVNKSAFQSLRDEWGCNVVRLALYTHENGYCSGGNKTTLKQLVNDGVAYATELGMYVVIDWHVLNEQNPNTYKSEAITFFDEMSKKYASYDNVIYEICNEPNGGVSWSQVKSYAEEVIAVIRANDKDAIIIVGTPTWSQDVDQAANSPITGYDNIVYALHFYAATHTDWLRTRMVNAINAGLPIIVSEFGICDASGNGNCDISQANSWVETMDKYDISFICWNLANKNESSSLINSGCSKTSGWSYSELSTEGKWLVDTLGGSIAQYTSGAKKSDNSTGGVVATPTPTPSSQGGGTSNATSTPVSTKAPVSGSVTASVDVTNSWTDGSGKAYQCVLTVNNGSSAEVSDWTVTVTYSGNVSLSSSWNGTYSASGNSVTVKPADDWTKTIGSGGSITDLGFIVSGADGLTVTNVKITY